MQKTNHIQSQGWPEGQIEGFIPVDGGSVFYHFYGQDKKGIPIIFLHGGPGASGTCFFKQTALADKHPIVIYNQLGSEGSDFDEHIQTAEQAKKYLTIEHFVNELQTVIDYFGFDEFIIAGHSWGTMLAVEYAAAKQPAGLNGIVLDGPCLNVDTWCNDAQRLLKSLGENTLSDGTMVDGKSMWDIVQKCEASGIYFDDIRYRDIYNIYSDHFFSRFENVGCDEGTPSDMDVTQHKIPGLSVYEYIWGQSEFSCTGRLKGHDSTPLLSEIKVPILYICGEYDCGTPEAAEYYSSITPDGEICIIPGCAHNSTRERPQEYNAAVSAFACRISK